MEEKFMGTGMIFVADSLTGLQLDCDVRYAMSCTMNITDEKDYSLATATDNIRVVLQRFTGTCFDVCWRTVCPKGVEYTNMMEFAPQVAEQIRQTIQPIMNASGVSVEKMSFLQLGLMQKEEEMFASMRAKKPQATSTGTMKVPEPVSPFNAPGPFPFGAVVTNPSEWVCSCGKKNTTKFCPECGSKKP